MIASVEHPEHGSLDLIRNAVRMTDGPPTVRTPSPMTGQHTDEVLAELGLTPDEISDLHQKAIV
jgi:crotonobetainyl-CoA:carnitine CoA-transferase CaiB-like acyl-CoA transferase